MKKTSLVTLLICMLVTLAACGDKNPEAEKEEYTSQAQVTES